MIDGKKLKEYKVFFVKNGYMFSDEFWSEDYITDHKFIDIIELMEKKKLSELAKKPKTSEANLNIPDVIGRFSGESRMKLQKHFVELYGDTPMAKEKANSFAVGFGKACDMIIKDLNTL